MVRLMCNYIELAVARPIANLPFSPNNPIAHGPAKITQIETDALSRRANKAQRL